MSDLVTIYSSVLPYSTRVIGFRGTEAISRPYEFEIFLSLPQELGEELILADAIGAKAHLVVDRAQIGIPPFTFAGVLASVEVLHAFGGRILARAELRPRLWRLGLSRHSRIFTRMTVPDIITQVLEENGVTDFELRLGAYEVEEHVCQYRESDLAFISRWMEREGISYFFEHGDDGEKLVLVDQRLYDGNEIGAPVRYFPQLGHDRSAGPSFRAFACQHTTLPASVRLKDYDYGKPNLIIAGAAPVAENGVGEVSVYGDRFFTAAAGERLAKIRAEELLTRQVVFRAKGTRLHLRSGYTFELEEHPLPSFNTRYLTILARHSCNQATGQPHFRELTGIDHDDVYLVELEAIPARTQFRAESVTPWPRVHGSENGVIDGPAESDYAQIDDQGRYNAKFKFDESSLKNGKATTWVRMMQPHGGDIEGFHFPLRKGTEVVFGFLNGDPDRPVISGVVPNTVNPSPITIGNYTRNVIQTGGRNRFEMEDLAGQQRITMSTPYANTYLRMGAPNDEHEMIIHTDEQTLLDAGLDFNVTVSNAGHGDWTTIVSAGDATLSIPKGYWGAGVLNGFDVTAHNGINFQINAGCGVPAAAGAQEGFTVHVAEKGASIQAKESISLTSDTAEIHATAEKQITITSKTEDIIVHAKKKVKLIADADQHVTIRGQTYEKKTKVSREEIHADSYEYRYGNSSEEVHGNKTERHFGDSESTTDGNSNEIVQGTTNEVYIGLKHSVSESSNVDLTVGGGVELSVGGFMELTAALKAVLDISGVLELNFGVHVGNEPLRTGLFEDASHAKAVVLRNQLVHAHFGSVNLRTYGLHCHVP